LSGLKRMPTETSFMPFTDRGLTAPPGSNSHRWNSGRSWPRSCPCRGPTSCAMPAVWRRIASCGTRASRHRTNRVWTARRRRRKHRIGTGPGCWATSSMWIWRPVFRHCVGGGKRADALRRRSRARPCDLPFCRRGSLRIIAAITQESVITRILRHLKLASVPPPIAPARCRQEIFAFD
jgi:hypothetical protein